MSAPYGYYRERPVYGPTRRPASYMLSRVADAGVDIYQGAGGTGFALGKRLASSALSGAIPAKRFVPPRSGYTTMARTRGVYGTGEMKYFDTECTNQAIPASTNWTATEMQPNVGTPNTFVVPTVGSAINQRIGRDITLYKLKIRGNIVVAAQADQTVLDVAGHVRFILLQDMQTNSAQVQGEQVMQPSVTSSALNNINTYQNLANFGRFKVHRDEIHPLRNPEVSYDGTNIEQGGYTIPIEFNLKFPGGLKVRFNATNGGTISDIVDNSFTLLATCSNAQLVPLLYYSARACYKE